MAQARRAAQVQMFCDVLEDLDVAVNGVDSSAASTELLGSISCRSEPSACRAAAAP